MYSIIRSISKSLFKAGVYDYTSLEAPDGTSGGHRFSTKAGGFVSYIRVHGSLESLSGNGLLEAMELITSKLSGTIKKPGFQIHIMYDRDPEASLQEIQPSIDLSLRAAKRFNLDVKDILLERAEVLSAKTAREICIIALQTDIGSQPAGNIKEILSERLIAVKGLKTGIKPNEFGQSPFMATPALRDLHNSFVSSATKAIDSCAEVSILDHHSAIRCLRQLIVPEQTGADWRPNLLGDRMPTKTKRLSGHKLDASHLCNPDISFQLFPSEPYIPHDDPSLVRIGERLYGPLNVEVPPERNRNFGDLFNEIDSDVPWRFSVLIKSGHDRVLSKVKTKSAMASLLAFTSSVNKQIREAAEEVLRLGRSEGVCEVSMSLLTWGETAKDVRRRKSKIMQSAQSWGSAELFEEAGDPLLAFIATIPGLSLKNVANSYAMPFADAIDFLPVQRPASPWPRGTVLFRTLDEKIFPMLEASSLQPSSADLYYAPPGSGKSVLMAIRNLGFILRPQNGVLPLMAILDIGPSAASFISLVRAILPETQKHLAQSFTLENDHKNSINVFDLPLGMEMPLATDRNFLINFLTILCTPAGQESIPRLGELLSLLVQEAYTVLGPEKQPHIYSAGTAPDVDEAITRHGIAYDDETSWYEIRDILFDAREPRAAIMAQRYAVPRLPDLNTVLQTSRDIQQNFGEAMYGSERLIPFLQSMITSQITEYPILSQPTKFDIGNARIMSMDLMNVSGSGSAAMNKRTGLMYMLARQCMTKDFYRKPETFSDVSKRYKAYHVQRCENDMKAPKVVRYDELHRTSHCPEIGEQLARDIREGRKFDVVVGLASQMLKDFSPDIVSLATNIFILGKGGDEESINEIRTTFGINSDIAKKIRLELGAGPGSEGSKLLYIGNIRGKKSKVLQFLYLTVGGKELWAYSTTPADRILRDELCRLVPLGLALEILSERYPSGSANEEIQEASSDSEDNANVIRDMAAKLISDHRSGLR